MRRSSRSPPPPRSRDATRVSRPATAAEEALDEDNAVLAASRRWVGWEEDVALEKGRRVVYYYLRCAPPRGGGGGGGGGGTKRELAVMGTLRAPGRMAYVVHGTFLRSLEAAAADRATAPSRVAAAAVAEANQLRWQSRKEVMDWLTALVSDSTVDGGFDEYLSGDHDGDDAKFAGSAASKDISSTFVGNNSEGFAWIGPVPHNKRRKHYRSFCRRGITISVHDFVYIKSEDKERHVAYVEDMYEDINANNMVLVRWFDKVNDDHGVTLPPGVNNREIFFSYALQELRVEWVDGLAAVLNAQHFEKIQNSAKHSNWQPYLCYRQIENDIVRPFDITQLQGYSNQEILQTIFSVSSSMKMHIKAPNNNRPSSDGGQKRKRDAINDQAVENHAPRNVINDQTVENHGPRNVINDQTVKNHGPHKVINNQTVKNHAPHNIINDQIVKNHAWRVVINGKTVEDTLPSNASNDQTAEKCPPHNATTDQTVQKCPPRNATTDQTAEKCPSRNATTDQTVEKCPLHSGTNDQTVQKCPSSRGSASGLLKSVLTPNVEQLFQPGCRVEALSQDSSIRGCWFRCVIVKRRNSDFIKVRYQDVQNAEETGNLKEWLKLTRIAHPDQLGIRLSGRPMIRPQLPQRSKIPSTLAVGTIVDAWWYDGWWEGIVVQQETVGRVRVYFPGEKRVVEFHEGDLRRSFEWVGNKWMPLMARNDIACRLPPGKDQGNQVKSQESGQRANPEMHKTSLQSNMGGEKSAKPVGQSASLQLNKSDEKSAKPLGQKASLQSNKGDDKSSKPVEPKAGLQSSQKADAVSAIPDVQKASLKYGVSAKLAVQKTSLQSRAKCDYESAKTCPQRTTLQSSFEELRLQSSNNGPEEPAKPATGKVIVHSSEKDNDMSAGEKIIPDRKRCVVDLTNALKSDNLKWAERKARGSCGPMEYSDGSSSQEDIKDSAPSGDIVTVNSGPDEEVRNISGEPPVGTTPTPNLLMSK